MNNETNQNLTPIPDLNQNPPPEPKFFLKPKLIILALASVLILALLVFLAVKYWDYFRVAPVESTVVSEVKIVDGNPRVFINGIEEKNLMMAEVYHYRDNVNKYELPYGEEWVSGIKEIINNASSLGAKVISLPIWWNEIDKSISKPASVTANLDFSPVDQVMDYAKSKNMYIMMSPEMHKMIPIWWAEENNFPPLNLELDSSLCIPKEKDAEASCVPKELCDTGQPCCKSETTNLYCCDLITEITEIGSITSERLDNGMVKCAKANNEPYKKCDFCEMDSFGWKYPFPSKGSDKVQADYGEYLKVVIDRYKNHPALFGWQFTLGAMGEDFYGDYTEMYLFGKTPPQQLTDYSPFFAKEFFNWLRSKYQSNQKLQDAWGDSTVNLSKAFIPLPRAFFENGQLVTFPDQCGSDIFKTDPNTLNQKGKDFCEFREFMRDKDRQYFVSLFKKRDPLHLVIYGTAYNDNVLTNTQIDGSSGNPNLKGGQSGDKYDVTLYYQEIKQTRNNGKVMFYGAENGRGVSTENENQLKAIERFGKAVKCFGGYFGYVTEIPQKTNGKKFTMPSWDSEGARAAIRNIMSYSPATGCTDDFISNQTQGKCGDGVCDGPETSTNCPADCKNTTPPTSLQLVSQIDVTPPGQSVFRPDVIAIGEELWFAYNSPSGPMLQRLNAKLNKIGQAIALQSATEEMITDIRVDSADGQFWMGYESILMPEIACNEHFLNVASYTSSPPQVSKSVFRIAKGCALNREFMENPTGLPANPEFVDDPTPFFHKGVRYILTRAWGSYTIQHLRKLNTDLSVAEDILLDTSTFVPGRRMSQNALLHIDGKPFLVAGFSTGIWVGLNTSDLYVLPLSDDLHSFSGQAVRLAVTGMKFPTRITRARYVNGTLIINFNSIFVGMKESDYLGLFDVANGFSLLNQIQIHDHEVADNHSSFEILGDKLYLFQQQDGQKISAKIFQLK